MLVARTKNTIKKSKCSLNGDNRILQILVLEFFNIKANYIQLCSKHKFNVVSLEK